MNLITMIDKKARRGKPQRAFLFGGKRPDRRHGDATLAKSR